MISGGNATYIWRVGRRLRVEPIYSPEATVWMDVAEFEEILVAWKAEVERQMAMGSAAGDDQGRYQRNPWPPP